MENKYKKVPTLNHASVTVFVPQKNLVADPEIKSLVVVFEALSRQALEFYADIHKAMEVN